ncbi:ergothioneine biosynthesis protein EgtB [Neoroseomonas soli]|uniref:Ergothioneine biosynthesis protein EgtB n=1 Tax=Neoroseomonas soli TaxID=1081025 RepID=A0A9X9WR95_9PROT|nr:ergothioneine biosynthesis protein EgtB [Neoroseomonas soli]MBR0669674.1 ergothioneine biosynthesis protein EgtB [Neoroseomonas soli]
MNDLEFNATPGAALARRFTGVRARTEALVALLSPEDQVIQSMPDASPAKWHRAHTTWFFETFVLRRFDPGYQVFDPGYAFLFNSYYEAAGPRHARPKRGLLTRPGTAEVSAYRIHVDAAMARLLAAPPEPAVALIELGLQHEEQHQELLRTDMLHALAENPLRPAWDPDWQEPSHAAGPITYIAGPEGVVEIGHAGPGFAFDNETPRHRAWLAPYRIADRLITNGAWLSFIEDGGYRKPTLWMSDGWAACAAGDWKAPLYWEQRDGAWWQFTPGGVRPLEPARPVRHVSWYEADAFARWAGKRLPIEAEFEAAARLPGFHDATGIVWQWTGSAYRPYPGFQPWEGAIGEYNGKFMVGQMVLRGGSLATPPGHARPSYRNFFPPDKRWQFSGVRLAEDA